jgi:Fe-S-cluster containining protein
VKGVKVTQEEWRALEEDIDKLGLAPVTIQEARASLRLPTKGENDLRRCVFLKGKNVCEVYESRPQECRRFPIWTIEGRVMITFVVSYVCPRAEALAVRLKKDLPDWARELLNGRPYRVVLI